jgi:ferrochelatase
MAALRLELEKRGIDLPVYWGNRNWHPLLPDTLRQMAQDGRRHALAFFTSIFSSYSGCRQYRENIAAAQSEVGADAPQVHKVRMGFNHPGFVAAQSDLLAQALRQFADMQSVKVLFTAHSIPKAMSDNCRYVEQLKAAASLIAQRVGISDWELAFQSRSGPPTQPWLEPDICDRIEQLSDKGVSALAILPLGFISDHMEVLYDLDTEAAQLCEKLSIQLVRVPTVGVHPAFVGMIADLIQERLSGNAERPFLGDYGPSHDVCPVDCCLYTPRRP